MFHRISFTKKDSASNRVTVFSPPRPRSRAVRDSIIVNSTKSRRIEAARPSGLPSIRCGLRAADFQRHWYSDRYRD
ncbi:hypothetical protein EVAR_52983_1 [Eumeta japonica]|uniref:Uncharacterized protein n=1 Tax=Eumeta variegata TaxID=151549 RepID=A0A4C1Z434_EUMVA|nr:hypothetical protein EVAR_52983_1 [Eumeta japonica]